MKTGFILMLQSILLILCVSCSVCVREVYRSSIRRSDRSVVGGGGSPSGSSLPSLVDVKKSTAEEVCT